MMAFVVVSFLACVGSHCKPVEVRVPNMPEMMCSSGLGGQIIAAQWIRENSPRATPRDIKCKIGEGA